VNAASPTPVTNADFSRALGRTLRRPSWLRVPGFALRLIFGEMANDMLIAGQRVVPRRALEAGFAFKYPEIDSALNSALHNPKGPTT
jgi:NAD dependent epimerase/dehydratase family enzyme